MMKTNIEPKPGEQDLEIRYSPRGNDLQANNIISQIEKRRTKGASAIGSQPESELMESGKIQIDMDIIAPDEDSIDHLNLPPAKRNEIQVGEQVSYFNTNN